MASDARQIGTEYAGAGERLPASEIADGLPLILLRFLQISAALTVAALVYSLVLRLLGFGLPYSFPYYFVPNQMGSDLRFFWTKFFFYPTWHFYTGEAGYFMYPLPLFYLLRPMFATGRAFVLFIGLVFLLTSTLVYVFVRAMRSVGMRGATLLLFSVGTVLLSYPVAFEYLRLNVEIVLFSFTAFALLAWWRQRPYLAAVLLGVAGACKIYPLILVGLLFSERRWRAVGLAFATALAVTLACAWAFGPTVHDALAWNGFQLGLFQKRYAGLPSQLGYDHSFFGLLKFVTLPWHPYLNKLVPWYVRVAAVGSLLLYFLRIRHLPRLNQVLILSILSVTLPPVSYDYTLLAVYPPLLLLSMELVRRAYAGAAPFAYALRYFVLFGVLLTPLSFVTWYSNPHHAQVRCVCLIAILWTALRFPIEQMRVTPEEAPRLQPAVVPG